MSVFYFIFQCADGSSDREPFFKFPETFGAHLILNFLAHEEHDDQTNDLPESKASKKVG